MSMAVGLLPVFVRDTSFMVTLSPEVKMLDPSVPLSFMMISSKVSLLSSLKSPLKVGLSLSVAGFLKLMSVPYIEKLSYKVV